MASSRFNIEPTASKRKKNFLLVWADGTVHGATADAKNTLQKLRAIVPDVQLIDRPDKAIDVLTNTDTEASFVITSGAFGQELVPRIHFLGNLDAIFIFCQNVKFHSEWSKTWNKVIGVNNKIDPICAALQQAVKQCNQDNIAMVLFDAGDADNLNELPPSFMYTTLLKDVITKMEHDHSKEIETFCQNALDKYSSKNIQRWDLDQFQQTYQSNQAIQWYTKQTFVYPMMNDGLRYLQGDVIVGMGFYIHDLHHQLVQLHQEQSEQFGKEPFKIYRGQALPEQDLQQLLKKKGGLLGFNNFLSTSLKRERSMIFALGGAAKPNCVGVLFTMLIDPRLNRIPFADIHDMSDFPEEAEVLFGMHAVFRIISIQPMGSEHPRLYDIELQLTTDDDPQLSRLTEHMGEHIGAGWDWHRIGWILEDMNQLDKAEEVYLDLLKENPSTRDKGLYNNQLGLINHKQSKHDEALDYYLKGLEFNKQVLPEDDPELATTYNNIGSLYRNMGEYPKALSYYEKSLTIREKILPDTYHDLATSYNNIGEVYYQMGEYAKALSCYEKSLAIFEKTLPDTHPDLAQSYNNIGVVYGHMGEYPKALSHHEKSLSIREKTLPDTHPTLAASYNNTGLIYLNMGDYPRALSYYEKSLAIYEKTLLDTHPDLAASYNNIGLVYDGMREYPQALSYYEKSLTIYKKTLPDTHPHLAVSYKNMGSALDGLGEYSKALELLNLAVTIFSKSLPSTHAHFASLYKNFAFVYRNMKDYRRALEYFKKAETVWKKAVPATHPNLAKVKQWIEEMEAQI